MEIVDIVDKEDKIVGSAPKDDVKPPGLLSRVAFVILLNSNDELFLQQRKATKKTYPLYWSGSAAGHVQSGESYTEAALRETKEEIGVETDLQEVGKFISEIDREIVTVFIGRSDGPYTIEEASIEKTENYTLDILSSEESNMKMTSYLEKAIPLVKRFLDAAR